MKSDDNGGVRCSAVLGGLKAASDALYDRLESKWDEIDELHGEAQKLEDLWDEAYKKWKEAERESANTVLTRTPAQPTNANEMDPTGI